MRTCVLLALLVGADALLRKPKAQLNTRSGFHVSGGQDCVRKNRTVRLKTSSGPRKVRFEDTREPGYLDEPQLREIFYINKQSEESNRIKMEEKLNASMKSTKVNYYLQQKKEPTIKYSRYPAWEVKDRKKKESKRLEAQYSNGEMDLQAKMGPKIEAIWLTQVSLLEKIANKVNHTKSDHTDVYFILEDDIAFVHDDRDKEHKTDWIEQAMCHISKLPADWDFYKFGYWTESLQRRAKGTCGSAKSFNEFSCQNREMTEEAQWEIMGNQAYAVRPQGAANMLKYLKGKYIMDVDGAMVPMAWQPINQPNYYSSRIPLVWHHAPHVHNLYNFIQRRVNFDAEQNASALLEQEKPGKKKKQQADLLQDKNEDGEKEETKQQEPKKEKSEGAKDKVKIEAWYVNLKSSKARNKCISMQLKEQGFDIHRFEAVAWPKTCGGNTMCLKKSEIKDCIQGGIAWGGISTHGTQQEDVGRIQAGVLANWCSHKRLFEKLEAEKNTTTEEEYILVFEDDVILHSDFKQKVEKFIQEFDGKLNNGEQKDWMFVQIDPFGRLGTHRGKFDGGVISVPNKVDGDWFGMHALLMKKSALPRITKWMREHKAIPIDWIPKRMNNFIAWKAHIAENPEVLQLGGHIHPPSYCSKDALMSSNIAGERVDRPHDEGVASQSAKSSQPAGLWR